jgi:hypothetical protein
LRRLVLRRLALRRLVLRRLDCVVWIYVTLH